MFGEQLKMIRTQAGMSQKSLAEKLFVSQQSVWKWERNESSPNPETIAKIAGIFNISADYLLGRTDEKVQLPTGLDEKLDRNIILISGRDGSRFEYEVSDGHKELVKQVLDNLKPAEEKRL